MWKYLLTVIGAAVVEGLPAANYEANAFTINQKNDRLDNGYIYEYYTSNGISKREMAQIAKDLQSKNAEDTSLRVNGFYSYTDSNGKFHRVDYTADENGFVARLDVPQGTGYAYAAGGHGGEPPVKIPQQSAVAQSDFQAGKIYEDKGISTHALASLGGG